MEVAAASKVTFCQAVTALQVSMHWHETSPGLLKEKRISS